MATSQSSRVPQKDRSDQWGGFTGYLRAGIEGRVGDVADLSFLAPSSVNFAFASNLFEHIDGVGKGWDAEHSPTKLFLCISGIL
jgi:hypothetical protein